MENGGMVEMNLAAITETGESLPSLNAQSLSSAIVSLKLQGEAHTVPSEEAPNRLLELLQSPSVNVFLRAASSLAKEQGIQPDEALKSILNNLKEIDQLWSQILLKEGLARLSTQLH